MITSTLFKSVLKCIKNSYKNVHLGVLLFHEYIIWKIYLRFELHFFSQGYTQKKFVEILKQTVFPNCASKLHWMSL